MSPKMIPFNQIVLGRAKRSIKMRPLLALILVSFLSFAFGYDSGKEYLYKLEGYSYASLRNTKPQYAGVGTIADVIVQVKDKDYFIKIKDVKFDTVNDLIPGQFEKYPFDFKELPSFSEHVTKPFKVNFDHGLVNQFYISDDEPDWSVDLKKSFLNLLQLCTDHSAREHTHAAEDQDYYVISEKGSFGECDTTYQIGSDPTAQGENGVFNVTKVRNYDKCNKKPHPFVYTSSPGIPCDDCEYTFKKNLWQAHAIYDYNVKGTRSQYVIEKVVQREFIFSSLYGQEGRTIEFRTRRTLELVQVKDIGEALAVPANVNPETDLTAHPLKKNEFFDKIDLRKAHYLRDIYRYHAQVSQLTDLFNEVVEDYAKSDDANNQDSPLPAKFGLIVDLLSTLDQDEIEQVHKAVSEKSPHHKKLFYNALSAAGTNPAFGFAKSLIEQKKLDDYPAYKLLQRLSLNIKEPSEALFNEYLALCQSAAVKEDFKLKKTCYLTFSGIVGRECVQTYLTHYMKAHHHLHHKKATKIADHSTHHCHPDIAGKYFKALVKPEVDEKNEKELNLLIKTAGNFKAKESIDYLKKIIDGNQHHHLRATAAWNLIPVARYSTQPIAPVVSKYFFNKNEENDVRIASFVAWFWGSISYPDLQMIAKHLMTENNRQIVNFVYTTIKNVADSKLPCQRLAKLRRDVASLAWVYKIAFDRLGGKIKWMDSRNNVYQRFNDDYNFGAMRQISTVANNRSYIPASIYLAAFDSFGPRAFEKFSVQIQSYGLEKVINKLFGHKGAYWRKTSIFDFFKKRTARDAASVDADLKKIEKALPIETRDYEEVHGQITFMTRGYQVDYLEFDEELFSTLLKDGTISVPDVQKLLQAYIGKQLNGFYQPYDNVLIARSEFGVPYFYQWRAFSRVKVENNKLSMKVLPAMFAEERENKQPTELQASFDIKLTHHTDSLHSGGFLLGVANEKVGVGYHRRTVINLPLNADITYKYQDKKITYKKVPKTNTIFYDKLTPVTFLDSYSNKLPLIKEAEYKPIFKDSGFKKFERSYLRDFFGYGFKVDLTTRPFDKAEVYKFYSEHTLGERMDYHRHQPKGRPYELRIQLAPADTNPTTEFKASLSWREAPEEENEVNDFSSEVDNAYKDYTTSNKARQSETHVLKFEMTGEGNVQRNIKAALRYSHSRDRLFHKLKLDYDRAPLNGKGFKVCGVGSVRFPDYDMEKFVKLDTFELDHTINLTGKLAFGENCDNQAKINIKAQASQSDEQRRLERSRETLDPDSPNPYAAMYLRCKNGFKFRTESLPYCAPYLKMITDMRHLVASIDYENIPETFSNLTLKYLRMRTQPNYLHSDFRLNQEPVSPGHVQFESIASAVAPKVDMNIHAPSFTAEWKNVPYKYMPPLSTFPMFNIRYLDNVYGVERQPYCVIQGRTVQTFDNVTYQLPPIDSKCEFVIAKDSSPEHVFLVTGKSQNDKVDLTIFLHNKFKIELLKDKTVKLNGNPLNVKKTEPYVHVQKVGPREIELFSITSNSVYTHVQAGKFGLHVISDGSGYGLQVTRYFTGKVSGLCGDNNRDGNNEWRGANGKVYKNSNSFANSYLIPLDGCTPTITE